jgi:hypothetical protein
MSAHEHYDVDAMQRQWRETRAKTRAEAMAKATDARGRWMVEASRDLDEAELLANVWLMNASNAGRSVEEVGLVLSGMLTGIVLVFASNFGSEDETNARILLSIVLRDVLRILGDRPVDGAVVHRTSQEPMPGGRA